jgi:small redox-active disulfide protein 2
MEVRILGPGCANCNKLEQLVFNVCAEINMDADIQKITDYQEFAKYGVMSTPGLVVNGKLLSQGKIPTKATLEHWLKEADNLKI